MWNFLMGHLLCELNHFWDLGAIFGMEHAWSLMSPLFNDKIIVGMRCEDNNNNNWWFKLND